MDKSLDEVIAERPKTGRRTSRRGGARAQVLGNAGPAPAARARAAASQQQPKAAAGPAQTADKILVSNLPLDVNEQQVKELFHSTVGPLREVNLHFDSAGRSKGVAAVTFARKGDGNKAYSQYNNRLIDGKRPMKIEILVDPSRPQTLAERVAPVAAVAAAGGAQAQPARTKGAAGRGRGRGRVGARKTANKTPKSVADLDAEMEDYTASNAPAAPAATT